MERPRFQFTISGLIWATFWMAGAMGAFSCPNEILDAWGAPLKYWVPDVLGIVVLFCLCAAGGAVVGKQRKGLLVGLIVIGTLFALVGIHIARDHWHGR